MKFDNNILYLHYADLVPDLIPKGTYDWAKSKSNIDVVGHGGNGREVLIQYETLPSKWKAKVEEKYEDPYKYAAAQIIKPHLVCPKADLKLIRDFETGKDLPLPLHAQEKYKEACSYLALMASSKTAKDIKKLGFPNKGRFTETIQYLIKTDKVDLPANYSNLRAKLKAYEASGAQAVISSKWGNSNSEKITQEIEAWLINEMCSTFLSPSLVHKKYLKVAESLGFRKDISKEAFETRASRSDVMQLIYLKRHGRKAFQSKYGHTFKLIPALHADDLWVGDGTKVDLYFFEKGAPNDLGMATVYMVADDMSEKILGWSIRNGQSKENYEMQLEAYRMAVRTAGSKPYQLLYDNQGGHKTAEARRFYDQLAHVHFPTRAYRASGKSIEQLFSRFQREKLAEYPFWTGFGRHTHVHDKSRPNYDDVKLHKEQIPTYDELIQLLSIIIEEWNADKHPKQAESRNEIYATVKAPDAAAIEMDDMINMFFLTTTHPITYQRNGITLERGGLKKTYEVYDENGNVDFAFRERWMKAKFHIKYDPENEYPEVQLLMKEANGDFRPIAYAQDVKGVNRTAKNIQPGERSWIDQTLLGQTQMMDTLDAKATQTGYDGDAKYDNWKSKLKPTRKKRELVPVDGPEERPTKLDFLDKM